jgi:glutamyl-tRNA synthetase
MHANNKVGSSMKNVRVRYAPSPTGQLHIGNARSALFNYLFARHYGGTFIVRIEDTDTARNVEGGEASQLENLAWLGIDWDESPDKGGPKGPYRQLERLDIYRAHVEKLLKSGMAYKEYREESDKYAVRFKVPEDKTYVFDDLVRGRLSFESKDVEDWIIMKDNGIPTYNFAVVIDDHLMEITHVLRGEEHITNTPKQLMVYEAFGWDAPMFGHMTIIVNEQRKKLSKRDKDVIQFIAEYQSLGYLPDAMFNFIALLGWSPPDNTEIMDKDAIIEAFDPSRLSKAPAMFDRDKLKYVNSKYIKAMDTGALASKTRPYLERAGITVPSETWLHDLAGLFQDRMTHVAEIVTLHNSFFHPDFTVGEEEHGLLMEFGSLPLLEAFRDALKDIQFESDAINTVLRDTGKALGVKGKPLYMGIRIATTGDMHGPSLPHALALLGRDTIINRLNQTITTLRGES